MWWGQTAIENIEENGEKRRLIRGQNAAYVIRSTYSLFSTAAVQTQWDETNVLETKTAEAESLTLLHLLPNFIGIYLL
jgi:hypothetical protein